MATCIFENETEFTTGEELTVAELVLAAQDGDREAFGTLVERYQQAVYAASEAFGAGQNEIGDARVLDVRRAGVHAQADSMIPGAQWRDPAAVATWSAELPRDHALVVYCVYGHEVGRATALRLRAAGLNARFLRGGIDGWQAAGRSTQTKGTST